jgi:hypothetical protein
MMNTPPDSNATPTPAVEPPARIPGKRSRRARWLIPLVVILVLVAAAAGLVYHFYGNPLAQQACVPSTDVRHTLPCDIPLLSDATFKSQASGKIESGEPYTEWDFTTPETLDQLTRFYFTGFSADGWACVGHTVVSDLLAVAAADKANRPNTVALMAFQINVPMSPNEFSVVLITQTDTQTLLSSSFKCGS